MACGKIKPHWGENPVKPISASKNLLVQVKIQAGLCDVYINWYMMCYLKKICSEEKISFLTDASFFWMVCPLSFFGQSGHCLLVWPSSIVHRTCSMWILFMHSEHAFVQMLVLRIVCAIVETIMCMIIHMIFLVGLGFEPLALQHDLFVGPGFDSWTRSPVSGP